MAKPRVEITRLEDSPPWLDQRLVKAYFKTTYRVQFLDIDLRIGAANPDLEDWLEKNASASFAILTAWNPHSKPLPKAENEARNANLEMELRRSGCIVLPALGIGDAVDWAPEESFFVAGIALRAAAALGRKFDQNAFVFGKKGGVPMLCWLSEPRFFVIP